MATNSPKKTKSSLPQKFQKLVPKRVLSLLSLYSNHQSPLKKSHLLFKNLFFVNPISMAIMSTSKNPIQCCSKIFLLFSNNSSMSCLVFKTILFFFPKKPSCCEHCLFSMNLCPISI